MSIVALAAINTLLFLAHPRALHSLRVVAFHPSLSHPSLLYSVVFFLFQFSDFWLCTKFPWGPPCDCNENCGVNSSRKNENPGSNWSWKSGWFWFSRPSNESAWYYLIGFDCVTEILIHSEKDFLRFKEMLHWLWEKMVWLN